MCLGFSREMLAVAGIFKLVESLSQAAALRVLWLAVAGCTSRRKSCTSVRCSVVVGARSLAPAAPGAARGPACDVSGLLGAQEVVVGVAVARPLSRSGSAWFSRNKVRVTSAVD